MTLKVINSNSKGNCYVLTDNTGEMLLIECGVVIDKIKEAIKFDLKNVAGCILTHEHSDHSKSAMSLCKLGIPVFMSEGTMKALKLQNNPFAIPRKEMEVFRIGNYKVLPFNVKHDCAEPFGYLISHPECGNVLFMTDTYYCEYVFPDLNNIIIEANYCEEILDSKVSVGKVVRDRVIESHMSLQTCIKTLQAYDLKKVNNTVITHLSDSNSDEAKFLKEIKSATGGMVHIAKAGMEINFDKTPF